MNSMHWITLRGSITWLSDHPISPNALECTKLHGPRCTGSKPNFIFYNLTLRTGFVPFLSYQLGCSISPPFLSEFTPFFRRCVLCISYFTNQPTPSSLALVLGGFGGPKVGTATYFSTSFPCFVFSYFPIPIISLSLFLFWSLLLSIYVF